MVISKALRNYYQKVSGAYLKLFLVEGGFAIFDRETVQYIIDDEREGLESKRAR